MPSSVLPVKQKYYLDLIHWYEKAYPQTSKQNVQKQVNETWNKIKKCPDLPNKILELKNQLSQKAMATQSSLMKFWARPKSNLEPPVPHPTENPAELHSEDSMRHVQDQSTVSQQHSESLSSINLSKKTPAQALAQSEINIINSDLVGLVKRKGSGIATLEQEVQLKELQTKKKKLEISLKILKNDQARHKVLRQKRKENLSALLQSIPNASNVLRMSSALGRPRLEYDQPFLLKTICDIAMYGSAAHDRRQSDTIRSIKTLDELFEQLKRLGFQLSRSSVYIRLLPKRSMTNEGQRHVTTVPVRLIRAENDMHKNHIDGKFCTATIRTLEEIASLLGPNEVAFLSQDDKSRIAIGLTAANKQAPLLMHLEYLVSLPDHDWVIASKHKLIPSIYAGIQIKSNGLGKAEAVGYSGPTYAAVRSGKHCSSTAESHALDIERLITLQQFIEIMKTKGGLVKPVMIVTVDGGPDENPRYQKVIETSIHHFIKNDLDAFFIATNAPGRSAFNRVERRMAPLSRELTGLILPHDHYGSHLDEQRNTIDLDLERKNFEFAGQALCDIWSKVELDKFPTVAEFIQPNQSELEDIIAKDTNWKSQHIRTSQYFTQILKCSDESCCRKPRSSYFNYFSRFLSPPIPLVQSDIGLIASPDPSCQKANFSSIFLSKFLKYEHILPQKLKEFTPNLPYDLYCPSLQGKLKSRICKSCGIYFASIVMLTDHTKNVHRKTTTVPKIRPVRIAARRQREVMAIIPLNQLGDEDCEWISEEDVIIAPNTLSVINQEKNYRMPVVSVDQHFNNPWTDSE